MPVPDPSPDAGRCDWLGRCLFSVTIGGAVTVLVSAAAAILRTPTIGRAVIAPLFEIALTIGPTALRRCRGSTADEQQSGDYKFRRWLHGFVRLVGVAHSRGHVSRLPLICKRMRSDQIASEEFPLNHHFCKIRVTGYHTV